MQMEACRGVEGQGGCQQQVEFIEELRAPSVQRFALLAVATAALVIEGFACLDPAEEASPEGGLLFGELFIELGELRECPEQAPVAPWLGWGKARGTGASQLGGRYEGISARRVTAARRPRGERTREQQHA